MSPRKKKVDTVIILAKPTEHIRAAFQQQLTWVNEELQHLLEKSDIWLDLTPETDAIGVSLNNLEEQFTKMYDRADAAESELQQAKDDLNTLDENYDKISAALDLISEYNTCAGVIKFQTDNLLDEQVMDLFTQCLLHIQPVKLLAILQNIIQKENLRV